MGIPFFINPFRWLCSFKFGCRQLEWASLFTLVFICIFPDWSMGTSVFCLSDSGFLKDAFFSLSLMDSSRWTGDLFELCLLDFLFFRGMICVWKVDFVHVFPLIISLYFSIFVVTSFHWVCASVCWILAHYRFFKCSWNFGQSFGFNWISFSTRSLYLFT